MQEYNIHEYIQKCMQEPNIQDYIRTGVGVYKHTQNIHTYIHKDQHATYAERLAAARGVTISAGTKKQGRKLANKVVAGSMNCTTFSASESSVKKRPVKSIIIPTWSRNCVCMSVCK